MSEQPGGAEKTAKKTIGGRFLDIILTPGWRRRILTLLAVVLIAIAAGILFNLKKYRNDPSALVPPSASLYIEAKELDPLLKMVNAWDLWRGERRAERPNQLHFDIAAGIGSQVQGLGPRLPIYWLSEAKNGAFVILRGSGEGEKDSWALFLQMDNPSAALDALRLESAPGMLEILQQPRRNGDGVHRLTDGLGGQLTLAVIAPWLILSPSDTLPLYAWDSTTKTQPTLARSKMVPQFPFSKKVRGIFDPVYSSFSYRSAGTAVFSQWIAENSRVAFTASLGANGSVDVAFSSVAYTNKMSGGGVRAIFSVLFVLLGLVALVFVVGVVVALIGGGWLKTRALRAGVRPAAKPAVVEPSPAFKEDVGVGGGGTPAVTSDNLSFDPHHLPAAEADGAEKPNSAADVSHTGGGDDETPKLDDDPI